MAECKRVDYSPEPPQGGYCDVDFIDPLYNVLYDTETIMLW